MSNLITPVSLQVLKTIQLRSIATSLGLTSSRPTKIVVANSICECLSVSKFPELPPSILVSLQNSQSEKINDNRTRNNNPAKQAGGNNRIRILSIDVGIRNFAFCVLEVPTPSPPPSSSAKLVPNILAWERGSAEQVGTASTSTSATSESSPNIEYFGPDHFSKTAYSLSFSLLSRFKPHQILIERQRYRSFGGAAVQEWTLRVNMLESMLWGCFRTFGETGFWENLVAGEAETQKGSPDWKGSVESVSPLKVNHFWENWKIQSGKELENRTGTGTKTSHTQLVRDLLFPQTMVHSPNNPPTPNPDIFLLSTRSSQETASLFIPRIKAPKNTTTTRTPRKRKLPIELDLEPDLQMEEGLLHKKPKRKVAKGKLDDLADSLLQGLAWIKWEETRRLLSTEQGWEKFGLHFNQEVKKTNQSEVKVVKKAKSRKKGVAEETGDKEDNIVQAMNSDCKKTKERLTSRSRITRRLREGVGIHFPTQEQLDGVQPEAKGEAIADKRKKQTGGKESELTGRPKSRSRSKKATQPETIINEESAENRDSK